VDKAQAVCPLWGRPPARRTCLPACRRGSRTWRRAYSDTEPGTLPRTGRSFAVEHPAADSRRGVATGVVGHREAADGRGSCVGLDAGSRTPAGGSLLSVLWTICPNWVRQDRVYPV
jgi:hypothetical protein